MILYPPNLLVLLYESNSQLTLRKGCNCLFVCLMVFNATFNNISVISWQSVLLVEETIDLSQVTDTPCPD